MKKILMTLLFVTFGTIANAANGLHDFTDRSIFFLIKIDEIGLKKNNIIKEQIFPSFKDLQKDEFSKEPIHFLVKDVSFTFGLMAAFAKREIADYDVLVRTDLHTELSENQQQALLILKNKIQSAGHSVVVFATKNHQFYKADDAKNSDTAMAFINRWHPNFTEEQSQNYWLKQHGPLVMKTGLPPIIKSYTQVHTDIALGESNLFDLTYQGLSFETITSQSKFVSFFLKNPAVRKLNQTLLKDELNFTQPPLLFVFKRWGF